MLDLGLLVNGVDTITTYDHILISQIVTESRQWWFGHIVCMHSSEDESREILVGTALGDIPCTKSQLQ